MKKLTHVLVLLIVGFSFFQSPLQAQQKIRVVATQSMYGDIAKYIGGDKVDVKSIVRPDQDPHHALPKPSFIVWLSQADLFIETGLDLELWAPTLIDRSGNANIRSGQKGFVAVADGIKLLEVPTNTDRSQGDVHIYGNPHIYTSPVNAKIIAQNITTGLAKVSPENTDYFQSQLQKFQREIDNQLYGAKLVSMLGSDNLDNLVLSGKLISFLQENAYQGKPLLASLDGWLKTMLPLRGKKLVAYHKDWAYFEQLFGLDIIDYVEPKPGIPPSPKHVHELVNAMQTNDVHVILAANYFDERKVRDIAERVDAVPVIVPLGVGGSKETDTYFHLVDFWVNQFVAAYQPVQ